MKRFGTRAAPAMTALFVVLSVMSIAPAALAADVCVSVNGHVKVDKGNGSVCNSTDGNRAIAVNGSYAFADSGEGNMALSVNGSQSWAVEGDDNTAIAVNDSIVTVWAHGNGRRGVAINDSHADARLILADIFMFCVIVSTPMVTI